MTDSFSKALEQQAEVLDTRTGELFHPEDADHEDLVEILLALRDAEKRYRDWRTQVEDELVRRFGDRRAAQPVGGFEVNVRRGWSRQWDVEDVESLAADLVSHGAVSLTDITNLIVTEKKVSGTVAAKLLNRLSGPDLAAFSEAFAWVEKGRPKVEVTASVEIEGPKRG